MEEYEAGTCNINRVERKKRLVLGLVGFLNAGILALILAFIPQLNLLYGAVFLLNFVGFIGVLQYRKRFCTGLALKKKFKINDKEETVEEKENIVADRRKALTIIFESFVTGSLLTFALYIILKNF